MRILHVLNHTRRLSGQVHAAVDLACAQSQLGHEVCICSAGGEFDALLDANGVTTSVIDQTRRPVSLVKALLNLSKLVKQWRPDVVHVHMMASAVLAWPICKLAGIPLITTVHNEFQKSAILMGFGDRVIAVSEAVGSSMEKRGVPRSRLRVVLNGTIGSARFGRVDSSPAKLSSPSVLFVGGLHPRKGIADLLVAFRDVQSAHPNAHLTIVGEGPQMPEYQASARAMDLSVTFAGQKENPRTYLMGADIFVLPSHADPAPLVISEAREAGCAIIGTDVDGIPQLLEYGRAGILVPAKDPKQLAKAISSLVADPQELSRWRANSQLELDNLKISRVANQTISVYREVAVTRAEAALPGPSSEHVLKPIA